MPIARPDNIGFGERRIEHAVAAEFSLQAGSRFKDAALPFHFCELFFAAAVGDILAEHNDALIARHFVKQSGGNHFDHCFRIAVQVWRCFELPAGGIDFRREDEIVNRILRRQFRAQRAIGRFENLAFNIRLERFELAFIDHTFANEKQPELRDRVAVRFVLTLFVSSGKVFHRRKASANRDA